MRPLYSQPFSAPYGGHIRKHPHPIPILLGALMKLLALIVACVLTALIVVGVGVLLLGGLLFAVFSVPAPDADAVTVEAGGWRTPTPTPTVEPEPVTVVPAPITVDGSARIPQDAPQGTYQAQVGSEDVCLWYLEDATGTPVDSGTALTGTMTAVITQDGVLHTTCPLVAVS